MDYERSVLPNGLRVITSSMPHTRSVTVNIYVGAGSRYESAPEAGVSHFVEHMCFKGTAKRPTPDAISEAIDGVGGILNAATDRELTVYYIKVARPHFLLAVDVLADLLRSPIFDAAEMERERGVILEELATVADSPAQQAEVLLDQLMWPDQPLGWDVAGTPESVRALPRERLCAYVAQQYVPANVVVSVAGAVDHSEVVAAITVALGDWTGGKAGTWSPARLENSHAPHVGLVSRRSEQAHLELAVPGLHSEHPDRQALAVLSTVLGEGMSSRLFMEVRERRGLAYDVHAYVSHFRDAGAFTVYAGVDPKRVDEALGAVTEQLALVREKGIEQRELIKARELMKGRLLLRMEDTRGVSGWFGAQEMLLSRIRTVDDVVAEVDAVDAAAVHRVARTLLRPEEYHLAIVGPYRSTTRFERALRS
ncbi:MAG: insulinase family protein [Dehalococcoidia bacterium]|nr:insulinase family protein [Dehalococcoidia bacterium]